jgi:hypothetical protein
MVGCADSKRDQKNKKYLIIPAAGRSSRFSTNKPKWLLTHPHGKLMIEEEPKKRGRKKAVKEEPIKEEVTKEEPIKETPVTNEEEDDNEDIEYTMDDVHLICEKLYRDELLSVFEVETINDGNMDAGIKKVIEKMIENPKTKKMLEDIKHDLVDFSSFTGTPTEMENIRRNADYIIFITLFSQHIFYITHICVCQLFTSNDIDDELVNLLKERMINLFKKN